MNGLKFWLEHPLTRGLDIDDPQTTELRRRIIQNKSFLRQIYQEWYSAIAAAIPSGDGPVLELGSGAGFLDVVIPELISSDVFFCSSVDVILDGQQLPIASGALRAIAMLNVLHHLPDPRSFLAEAARCVQPGGVMVLLEPWVTPWSRWVYSKLHHEPFQPLTPTWEFPPSGPLSGANGALAWIIFERDRLQFESEFPEWRIQTIKPGMPFRYVLSGGVSLRTLMPGATFRVWRWIERQLHPWMKTWAMFARITLVRTARNASSLQPMIA